MIEKSDAPAAMKDLARKDADPNFPGSNRVLGARAAQLGASSGGAKTVGAVMASARGASPEEVSEASSSTTRTSGDSEDRAAQHRRARALGALSREDERPVSPGTRVTPPTRVPETAAERSRRDQVLRRVEDTEESTHVEETPAERRRRWAAAGAAPPAQRSVAAQAKDNDGETPAERRRRIAALGHSVEQDDEEGGGRSKTVPTLPNEASTVSARSRGIRFAEEPIRK